MGLLTLATTSHGSILLSWTAVSSVAAAMKADHWATRRLTSTTPPPKVGKFPQHLHPYAKAKDDL